MKEEPGISSVNPVSLEQDGERRLSEEDIVWADSCLSKDLDFSESGWSSFKEALLETLDAKNYSSPYDSENFPEEDKMEIVSNGNTGKKMHKAKLKKKANKSHLVSQALVNESPSSESINELFNLDDTPVSIASTSAGAESQTGDFWSTHKMEDVFLPTYDENLKDLGISDSDPEVDFVFQDFELEQLTEDIFKIWDFDSPPEENVLTKQLNKALEEETPDDSEGLKVLQDEALDDLISGLGNLVLGPISDSQLLA